MILNSFNSCYEGLSSYVFLFLIYCKYFVIILLSNIYSEYKCVSWFTSKLNLDSLRNNPWKKNIIKMIENLELSSLRKLENKTEN